MLNPDFRDALCAFNDAGADYLVVGAFAMAAHSLPRATGDIDFWVRVSPENAARVVRALAEFGAPEHLIDRAALETPGMVLQIGVPPSRIDVITAIEGVEFEEAWPERLVVELDGIRVPVLSRRHLLQNKRATGRPKDRLDVEALERSARRR